MGVQSDSNIPWHPQYCIRDLISTSVQWAYQTLRAFPRTRTEGPDSPESPSTAGRVTVRPRYRLIGHRGSTVHGPWQGVRLLEPRVGASRLRPTSVGRLGGPREVAISRTRQVARGVQYCIVPQLDSHQRAQSGRESERTLIDIAALQVRGMPVAHIP